MKNRIIQWPAHFLKVLANSSVKNQLDFYKMKKIPQKTISSKRSLMK